MNKELWTPTQTIREVEPGLEADTPQAFSFDAETDGLWGRPFALGALVYDEQGNEISRFAARLPDDVVTNEWVKGNVLPALEGVEVTHTKLRDMLGDFAKYYLQEKEDRNVIVHMGVPVESGVLRGMHSKGMIGDFDGPYPLIDVAGHLQMAGEDPTSPDAYVKKHGLYIPTDFAGETHNPLYDSEVAYRVWRHLMQRRGSLVLSHVNR